MFASDSGGILKNTKIANLYLFMCESVGYLFYLLNVPKNYFRFQYRSSRLLRSRLHRCPPSDFGPVRLGDFFRAAYSVPPSSLPAAKASGHSGFTTRTLLRNPQDSRAVLRTTAVFAPLTSRQGIYKTARTIQPDIYTDTASLPDFKTLIKSLFPKPISSKTASPSA